MNPPPSIVPDWRWGTAEGSREFDRLNDRLLSFREKVQWLEEAEDLSILIHQGKAVPADGEPKGVCI